MNLPYLKIFSDTSATIDLLSDAEAGRLLKALMQYVNGQEVDLPGQEKLVFAMLKSQIDRDAASYQAYSDKQRQNGSKGGRPKKPTGFSENPKNPTVILENPKKLEKEKEEDKEEDKDKEEDRSNKGGEAPPTPPQRKRFTPPSLEEVSQYCRERGNRVDPVRFVDFYAAKGWKVGSQPMKDWKAAVRTWEGRDSGARASPKGYYNPFIAMAGGETQ